MSNPLIFCSRRRRKSGGGCCCCFHSGGSGGGGGSGMSREDGLLLVGAALVCVQLFFALSWNLLQPPKIMCFQCANMLDFKVG